MYLTFRRDGYSYSLPVISGIGHFGVEAVLGGYEPGLKFAQVLLYQGLEALAAVGGSAAQIINVLVGFFVALTAGAAVVIGQIFGAGRKEELRQAIGNAVAALTFLGVLLMIFGLAASPALLKLLRTPEETMADSALYLRIYFLGVPFIMALNMESAILRALGDSLQPSDRTCTLCGGKMHVNGGYLTNIQHLNFGNSFSYLRFMVHQMKCSKCGATIVQGIPFLAKGHRITKQLEQYTRDLLVTGAYTLKQVSEITGLGRNTVKAIDLERLKKLYTIDDKTLIKPESTTSILGIDEFKLHDGHRYATHIVDMLTGHILWISHGKKKQVVYDFIEHVGLEWMDHVEVVACDMNSDF
ncbi:MAG: MATE family efflux transporter [Lachnospiraceae bacterium]|nr:MATE family efflux transporter [Lachnospiraceae bacterium]